MFTTPDTFISELAAVMAKYEKASQQDREFAEIHKIAESAISMLVILRQSQIQRDSEGEGKSLLG